MIDDDLILFAEFLGNEFAQAEDAGYSGRALDMRRTFYRTLGTVEDAGVRDEMVCAYTRHGGC